MKRSDRSPEFRAVRAAIAVLTVAILARGEIGCDPELALPMDPVAESCAELVMRDSVIVLATNEQSDAEGSNESQTQPIVVEISHPVTVKSENAKSEENTKLASCYFEDPAQGLMAAKAGATDNTDKIFRLKLTSPPQEDKDTALDIAEKLHISTQLMKTTVRASKRAGLETVVIPVQPRINAPKGGSLHAVEKGDTLTAIARSGEVSLGQLLGQNSTTLTDTIFPGQIIQIPSNKHNAAPVDPTEQRTKAIDDFIDSYGDDFIQELEGKLPADAVMAQAMKESGFGLSELAVNAHNFFGIKANKDWDGPTYKKRTLEEKSPRDAKLCLANDKSCKIERKLSNGNYEVSLTAEFREYTDLKECLKDYIKKIQTMYPDAAKADGDHYAALLVDKNDPDENVWATDSKYAEGVEALRILTTPQLAHSGGHEEPSDPSNPETAKASKYPIAPIDRVPVSTKFMETLKHVSLSRKGYERVTSSIFDATDIVKNHPNGKGFSRIPSGPHDVEMITNHFTDALLGDSDPAKFAVHYLNGANGKGMHFAIMRNGTVVRFVSADLVDRPMHNPPYSNISIGIEVDSDSQENILAKQIESLVYINWMILGQEHLRNRSLSDTVQGHSRLRMADGIVRGSVDASGKKGTFDERRDWPRRETEAMQDVMERAIAAGILPSN